MKSLFQSDFTPFIGASAAIHIALLSFISIGYLSAREGGGAWSIDVSYLPGSGAAESIVQISAPQEKPQGQALAAPAISRPVERDVFVVKPIRNTMVHEAKTLQRTMNVGPASLTAPSVSGEGRGDSGAFGNGEGGGGGRIRAAVLEAPKPRYPYGARMAGFEGRVIIDVTVSPEGEVSAASVRQSSGREDCDQSALDTLKNEWSFRPAQFNGASIESHEQIVVVYNLRDLS